MGYRHRVFPDYVNTIPGILTDDRRDPGNHSICTSQISQSDDYGNVDDSNLVPRAASLAIESVHSSRYQPRTMVRSKCQKVGSLDHK